MKSKYSNVILSAALSLLLTACIPAAPQPTPTPTATFRTSSEFVAAAWLAFAKSDFAHAQSLAQECVDKWETEASRQQAALTQEPPKGKVSEAERNAIWANWALNDVGTAYDIMGESLQKQGKTDEAKAAYEKVKTFPYARAWDEQGGFFWSPADSASGSLAHLAP